MSKNDKIYQIVSICGFLLHIFVFVFVLIVGFLPFCEKRNFYEYFIGFFGNSLSIYQPHFMMVILLLSCAGALLVIKYPLVSFFVPVCSLCFFAIAIFPHSVEAMIVGLSSPWIGGTMSTYGIGFHLISAASYIVYFDIAFFIYSIITLFIRAKTNIYMVLMFCIAFILMLILCSCKANDDPEEIITVNYNVAIVESIFQIPVEIMICLPASSTFRYTSSQAGGPG